MSRHSKRGRNTQPDTYEPSYPQSIYEDLLPSDRHPHLIFGRHQYHYLEFTEALYKIHKKECEYPREINWQPLEVVGVARDIRNIFTQSVRVDGEVFDVNDFEKLLGIQEPIYEELVMEFLATLEMFIVNNVNDRFLSFKLGGVPRQLSLKELAGCLGIYTDEEFSSHWFDRYIMTGARLEEGECNAQVWGRFSTSRYLGGKNLNKHLTSPIYRVIHKMLANTLTLRGSNREKVTLIDLWFLDKLESRDRINVPFAVGKFLHAYASGHKPNSKLCGGHFITRIAKGLNVNLKPRGVPPYTIVENDTLPIGAESYATAHILKKKGGTYVPYNPTPREAATVSRVGSRGKRPATTHDDSDEEEEEDTEDVPVSETAGHGDSSHSGEPAYWSSFMTNFERMHLEQQRFQERSEYEWGVNRYQNEWLIHDHERMANHIPEHVPVPYHEPPRWGEPGGILPAPIYDRDAALVELQRHQEHMHTSDYHQQQQDWGSTWSSPPTSSQPRTWTVPEPTNWQQEAHAHWLFGSPSPYQQQQQQDPTQDSPHDGGGWS